MTEPTIEAPTNVAIIPFSSLPLANADTIWQSVAKALVVLLKNAKSSGTKPDGEIAIIDSDFKVYQFSIGDGESTRFEFAHDLRSVVSYVVLSQNSIGAVVPVEADIAFTSSSAVVEFDYVPDRDQYSLILMGIPNPAQASG